MNKIMFDILMDLKKCKYDSRRIANELFKPFSLIDIEMENLRKEGYVYNYNITKKGEEYLKNHKINNAIILAAGVSSRFVPLCFEKPKGLLPVHGEVMIERQIRQLQEVGIKNIVIVVGFMKEKFYYLKEKYGVIIVETDDYKIRNNHASVWAAKEYLGNTIVTSSDLYFSENIFQTYAYDAYYTVVYKEGYTDERGIQTDGYDLIKETFYGNRAENVWVTLGYAYFNKRFSEKFINILSHEYDKSETLNKFWADIQDEHLNDLYMYAKRVDESIINEFDYLEELRQFDDLYRVNSGSLLMKKIADYLNTEEKNLSKFAPITKEDLSKGFTFSFNQQKYICKIDTKHNITEIHRYDDKIQELVNVTECFENFYKSTLPLCAAENIISNFGNMPLSMGFQERYIVGNTYSYQEDGNFIGSSHLLPYYEMISEECYKIFNAKYSDSRTLTGMNCVMIVLMSLTKNGDKILILGGESGGHASVKPICERLGLIVDDVPYDYDHFDLDYEKLNLKIKEEKIDYILLAPSDIIKPLDIEKIELNSTVLLYDVSQLMGLIGGNIIDNPINKQKNMVMFGGTHKTFPGPACGLILTNNDKLHEKLETTINPIYLRHTQMHQKVSLLFTLIEFENFGHEYQEHIVELSNELGRQLDLLGFDVASIDGKYSQTHEVFIRMDKETMNVIFENSNKYGITLNKKHKKLFNGYGIRLGTQEIARYNWPIEIMQQVAKIIKLISFENVDENELFLLLNGLPKKEIQFTFSEDVMNYFKKYL